MKRRAAAKGKSMYVIFGLLAILIGSLAYLALQKGNREGLEEKKGKADVMKSMESIMKDMGIDSAEIMKGIEGLKHKEGFEEGAIGRMSPSQRFNAEIQAKKNAYNEERKKEYIAFQEKLKKPATAGSFFSNLKFNKPAKQ